jgi:hypothetical protein
MLLSQTGALQLTDAQVVRLAAIARRAARSGSHVVRCSAIAEAAMAGARRLPAVHLRLSEDPVTGTIRKYQTARRPA